MRFLAQRITCCRKLNLAHLVFNSHFSFFFVLRVSDCNGMLIFFFASHSYTISVSVFGLVIMAILFLHELGYYITTYTVHQVRVLFTSLPMYLSFF